MVLNRGPEDLICSARDCCAPAEKAVLWKNPKIHHGRHKTWLACSAHVDFLRQYLAYRNFPILVVGIAERDSYTAADF